MHPVKSVSSKDVLLRCDVKCNHAWRKAAPSFVWLVSPQDSCRSKIPLKLDALKNFSNNWIVENVFKPPAGFLPLRLLCSSSRLCEVIRALCSHLDGELCNMAHLERFTEFKLLQPKVSICSIIYTISWYHFQIKVFILSVPIISKFYLKIAKLFSNRLFWKWRSRAWPGTKKSSRSTTIRLDAKLVLKSSRGVRGLIAI